MNANCRRLTEPSASTLTTNKMRDLKSPFSVESFQNVDYVWRLNLMNHSQEFSQLDEESNRKESQNKPKNNDGKKTMKWNYLTKIFGVDVMISERACDGFRKKL